MHSQHEHHKLVDMGLHFDHMTCIWMAHRVIWNCFQNLFTNYIKITFQAEARRTILD